jgi:hypothetical protein
MQKIKFITSIITNEKEKYKFSNVNKKRVAINKN